MVVQELGYDDDVDDELRDAIVERCGNELVDEDADDVVDVVLLWWREDDGDLVDTLVDALHPLADNGVIWLLTPEVRPARATSSRATSARRRRPPGCRRRRASAPSATGPAPGWSPPRRAPSAEEPPRGRAGRS